MGMEFSFPYQTETRALEVGGVRLEIECLKSLDETIDAFFVEYQKTGREELFEELCPYFGTPWAAGLALADFAGEEAARWRAPPAGGAAPSAGSRALEIGCGLALPSLVLARAGISMECVDQHPDAAVFLARNAERNGIPLPRFSCRSWQSLEGERFELILGSDILYDRRQPETLLGFLDARLAPGGEAWLADPGRPYLDEFLSRARAGGWRLEEEGRRGVRIFRLRR